MQIRDRIRELRRVKASDLRPHPRNWRTHPVVQRDALRGVLAEVGYADALLVRELDDGSLELIDGHLRAETTPEALVPVLVLDVTAEEATKILLTHDPLAALAGTDAARLAELAESARFDSELLERLVADLQGAADEALAGLDAADRPAVEIPESYQVVVECADEAQQQELFERLRGEGFKCRVLTL